MITKENAKKIGSWDKGGRFYINDEFHTETSRSIRNPSRRFPFSEWKHIFTKKYFNSLTDEQKELLK